MNLTTDQARYFINAAEAINHACKTNHTPLQVFQATLPTTLKGIAQRAFAELDGAIKFSKLEGRFYVLGLVDAYTFGWVLVPRNHIDQRLRKAMSNLSRDLAIIEDAKRAAVHLPMDAYQAADLAYLMDELTEPSFRFSHVQKAAEHESVVPGMVLRKRRRAAAQAIIDEVLAELAKDAAEAGQAA